jgi:hypothetical protein
VVARISVIFTLRTGATIYQLATSPAEFRLPSGNRRGGAKRRGGSQIQLFPLTTAATRLLLMLDPLRDSPSLQSRPPPFANLRGQILVPPKKTNSWMQVPLNFRALMGNGRFNDF